MPPLRQLGVAGRGGGGCRARNRALPTGAAGLPARAAAAACLLLLCFFFVGTRPANANTCEDEEGGTRRHWFARIHANANTHHAHHARRAHADPRINTRTRAGGAGGAELDADLRGGARPLPPRAHRRGLPVRRVGEGGGGEGVARGTQVRLAQSVARLCAPGLCGPAVAKRLERAEGRPCVPPLWSADAAAAAPIGWMEAATMRGPECGRARAALRPRGHAGLEAPRYTWQWGGGGMRLVHARERADARGRIGRPRSVVAGTGGYRPSAPRRHRG